MSDKTILVAHIHPFAPAERIVRNIEPGQTVEQIVSALDIRFGNPIAYINGNRVIREAWAMRKAHEDDHVVVKVVPAGGRGSDLSRGLNKGAGWTFLAGLGLFVAGFFTGGATWAIGYGLMAAGLTVGLGVAAVDTVNGMLSGLKGISNESVLSVRGGSNQMPQLGTKIPVILGRHLVTPFYGARPYTEIATTTTDGDTQYLRMLFCIGVGPLRISQIKIGENLLASNSAAVRNGAITCDGLYTDVEAELYQDGTNPTLYPNTVIEEQPSLDLKSAVEHWLTTVKNTDKIDVDVTFQSGLYKYGDDGTKTDHSVTVEVRRRAVASGTAWASCTLVGTFAVTAAKAKTLRYTLSQVVTAGQYEVGMKRITADDADGAKAQSIVQWTAFRSIRTAEPPVDALVRSKYVFLALRIKATSQLSGVISRLNVIAEADVPVWDGTTSGAAGWTASGISQNPAALYLWALRGPLNPRPIANPSIDWARLEALYTSCAAKGWTCNAVLASETRLRDILAKIASTARSTPTVRDGLYSVVVDEAKTTIVQHFTPRNVRGFSWTKAFADLPYGVLINFVSADDGYDSNQRIVPYDGYTEAEAEAKLDEIDLWGITDPELVYKHGRYRLAVSKLRPELMSFETDAEGIVCEPGDLVVVSHDAIVVGHASGRLKSVEVNADGDAISVIVDELVTMATGESYGIRIRRADGTSLYTTVTTVSGETNEIEFAVAIPAETIPAKGDLFTFGEAGIETARSIVAGIELMEDLACRIYLVDEAPGVHTADSGTIPDFVSRVSPPSSAGILSVVDTTGDNDTEDPLGDAIGDALSNATVALSMSTVSVKRSRANTLSPATITVSAARVDATNYLGRFTIELSHDGETYQNPVYTSAADEPSYAYAIPATMVVDAVTYYVVSIRVRLYAAGGTATRLGEALCTVALESNASAIYWGALSSAPSSGFISGDYYFDSNVPASGGGHLRYWSGSAWVAMTSGVQGYAGAVAMSLDDQMVWAHDNDDNTIVAVNAVIRSFVASHAFVETFEGQDVALTGTLRTGVGAAENARVAIQDQIGVYGKVLAGTGLDDLSIVADGDVPGEFIVKITKGIDSFAIGDTGPAGGKIIHINTDTGYAIEAAASDQSAGTGFNGITDEASIATGTAIGSGSNNTDLIVNQDERYYRLGDTGPGGGKVFSVSGLNCLEVYTVEQAPSSQSTQEAWAASGIWGGMTDWYLPTIAELQLLYNNKNSVGITTVNDIWSRSTQIVGMLTVGLFIKFIDGANGWNERYVSHNAFAIRSFTGKLAVQNATKAAGLCSDLSSGGFTDWFLPSKDELAAMRTALASTPEARTANGFADAEYWSSSEVSATNAWAQNFADGVQASGLKSASKHVRAVRSFTLVEQFAWNKDGGAFSADIDLIAGVQTVLGANEITITFGASIGHLFDDAWSFTQGAMIGLSIKDAAGNEFFSAGNGELVLHGKGAVPVGFIYVQFPGKSLPSDLFTGTWTNVSSTFAGDFFRAEGGNASAFESGVQASQNLSHTHIEVTGSRDNGNDHNGINPAGNDNPIAWANSSTSTGASGGTEARPANRTIRIWERTA